MTAGANFVIDIKKSLSRIERAGDFSCGGIANELPSIAGITIEGIGKIDTPVNESTAELLKSVARRAPFGIGSESVTDESIRRAWEIDAQQISIQNPNWENGLQLLVNKVSKQLGCAGKVNSMLYKALLYEKGGHFSIHRDTEKELGMFATLAIQLPSEHKGGNLVTTHAGVEHIHDFGEKEGLSACNSHYAAHFADVEHTLQEIEEGYRFALVYSLVLDHASVIPTASALDDGISNLANSLKLWTASDKSSSIGIILEHGYSQQGTSNGPSGLKGFDRTLYDSLANANSQLHDDRKIRLFIVQFTKNSKYYDACGNSYEGDEVWELDGSEESIGPWIDENGNKLQYGRYIGFNFNRLISLKEDEIDIEDEKWWGEVIGESYEGYQGNEAASKEEEYHCYGLVFYPIKNEFNMLMRNSGPIGGFEFILTEFNKSQEITFAITSKFDIVMNKWRKMKFSQIYGSRLTEQTKIIYSAFSFVIAVRSLTMAKEVLAHILDELTNELGLTGLQINELIACFGWEALNPLNVIMNCSDRYKMLYLLFQDNLVVVTDDLKDTVYKKWLEHGKIDVQDFIVVFNLFRKLDYRCDEVAMYIIESLEDTQLNQFIKIFTEEMKSVPNTDSSLRLILNHKLEIVNKLVDKGTPTFTWRMDADICGHPNVTEFLKSNEQRMTLRGAFNSVGDAKLWASRTFDASYCNNSHGYSADAIVEGPGKSTIVEIIKTRRHFEHLVQIYNTDKKEKRDLEKLLGLN